MLLNSAYNASAHHTQPLGYNTVETLLDDVSKQMAASNLTRRYSQGTRASRAGTMRVVKPASTSSSPRNSTALNRRKTVMADGSFRRRPVMQDQGFYADVNSMEVRGRSQSSRPVSWHPSTHLAPQPTYLSAYPQQASSSQQMANYYDVPNPALFSGYASPASAFSPSAPPFSGYEQQQYPFYSNPNYVPTTFDSTGSMHAPYHPSALRQQTEAYTIPSNSNVIDPSMYSQFEWASFVANGFNTASSSPPTPENFLPMQHPDPAFSAPESIPYHSLDDDESTGEELIGMGLYDTPEKGPTSDSQLDQYRALMMTQLLGHSYRKHEPTGKGLKLEETWNPPPSDDEEDDDDEEDEDQDAEGSTVDKSPEEMSKTKFSTDHTGFAEVGTSNQAYYQAQYSQNGWL